MKISLVTYMTLGTIDTSSCDVIGWSLYMDIYDAPDVQVTCCLLYTPILC